MVRVAEKQRWRLAPSFISRRFREVDFTSGKGKILLQVSPVVLFIGIWWVVALILDNPRVYPTPLMVAAEFVRILSGESELGSTYVHIGATFYRFFIAWVLSFSIGAIMGLLTGRIKILFDFFDNVGWIFFSVPAILWAFILLVAMGITDLVPIGVLMALLIPKVAIITAEGAKATPSELIQMADSFKANTWQKVKDIFLPHLIPYLVSSARVSFSIGVKVILVAEVVGLTTGIGFMVKYWSDKVFVAPLVAWGIIVILLALVAEYAVFDRLERRVAKWRTSAIQTIQKKGE
jgi:NitT/TauT family transport system permease protein